MSTLGGARTGLLEETSPAGLALPGPALALQRQGEPGERRGFALGVEVPDEDKEGLLDLLLRVGVTEAVLDRDPQ